MARTKQIDVVLHVEVEADEETQRKLDQILALLISTNRTIKQGDKELMATLEDVRNEVNENTDATDSAVTLLNNLSQLLTDAQGDPAAIAQIVADLDANSAALAAAVLANTPASQENPPPAENPTPEV